MNERLEYLREKTGKLTSSPGVYRMRNKSGAIIYIGKAKNLKNRVTSYFVATPDHTIKVAKMVEQVYDYDFIVTDSEYEALVLECSLIKMHKPKYNILLKDDKGYCYIKISNEEFPRITFEMQKNGDGNFLGPYTSTFVASQTVSEVCKVFSLPTCKRKFPADFKKARPCLNFYIKQCMGVCRGNISAEEYNSIISDALHYIKSGSENSVEVLTEKMNSAAEVLDFEKAAKFRDRISAIERSNAPQKIISENMKDTDVIAVARNGDIALIAILIYRNGRLSDRKEFFTDDVDSPDGMITEFILQYYSAEENEIPREIISEEELSDFASIKKILEGKCSHAVDLYSRVRGNGLKLIELAKSNANEILALRVGRTGKEVGALEALGKILGLEKTPNYIESYDISNLAGTNIVAGMVVFENGRPLKSAYKLFKIKNVAGQDDYACMNEVLTRRFSRYKNAEESDESFNRLPDLILLDGGKGQVNAVKPILDELGIDVPVYGMVKDGKHRTRAIMDSGNEISINDNKPAFFLVTRIQDEVHRFAISYQKKLRNKNSLSMRLTEIKGIGEKKAEMLLREFKTRDRLATATPDEIAKAMKINLETANQVFDFIHSEN